jgi:hypothetical protein
MPDFQQISNLREVLAGHNGYTSGLEAGVIHRRGAGWFLVFSYGHAALRDKLNLDPILKEDNGAPGSSLN